MGFKKISTTFGPLMADEDSGALLVTLAPYTTGAPLAKTCTEADNDYALSAQACRSIIINAHPDNAGLLWIGVGAAAEEDKGTPLAGGDRVGVSVSNASMIHVLAKTAGDKLCYQWVN